MQELDINIEAEAPEQQTEQTEKLFDPIYKHKDGRIVTKKQLLSEGLDDARIQKGLDNQIITQIGDTEDPDQEFQHQDGRKVSVKALAEEGITSDRIATGIAKGLITPIEKKNQLPSTSGLQGGVSVSEYGTFPIMGGRVPKDQEPIPGPIVEEPTNAADLLGLQNAQTKKDLYSKGYDVNKLTSDLQNVDTDLLRGYDAGAFTKDKLLQEYKENPQKYEDDIAYLNFVSTHRKAVAALPKEERANFSEIYLTKDKEEGKKLADKINQYGGDYKRELLNNLSKMTGEEYKFLDDELDKESTEKGSRLGYIYNSFLNGIGSVSSGASDVMMQILTTVLPEKMIGGTKEEALAQWRNEVEPVTRTAMSQLIGADVGENKQKKYEKEFWTSAIGGLAGSVPMMVSPYETGLFLGSYDAGLQSINNTEEGKKLPESTKSIFAVGVGLAGAALEKVGLDKIFGKQSKRAAIGIASKTISDLLEKSTAPITKEVFEAALNANAKTIKQKIIDAGGKIGRGASIEALTGASQEAANVVAEKLLNASQKKEVFQPQSMGEIAGRVIYAGAQEGVGGGLLGGLSAFTNKTRNYISEKVAEAKTPEDIQKIKNEVIVQSQKNKIGQNESEQLIKLVDDYANINSKVPENVENRKEVINTISERDEIKTQIDAKQQELNNADDAFKPELQKELDALQGRYDELNEEAVAISKGEKPVEVSAEVKAEPQEGEQVYRVDYKDEQGNPATKYFRNEEESRSFYESTPGEKTGYYDKFPRGGKIEEVTPTGAEAVPTVTGEAEGQKVEGAVPTGGERLGEGAAEAAPAVLADGFKQAGEKARDTKDATHIGRWMLDNSKKGDVVRFQDGGYEVTEVNTKKDGTKELVLTPFEFNEDGSKDYNNSGIKIISEQSIKNGSNLFENAYTNSKGERVVEQSTYEPVEAAPISTTEAKPETVVGQDVVIQQMKPFTDEMVKIEREFENNNYEIRTDYDNEIIVTDKDGEIVDAEDLPTDLLKLAQDYEKAVGKLGEFDASAMEKALAESRKVEEGQAEVVETEQAKLPPAAKPKVAPPAKAAEKLKRAKERKAAPVTSAAPSEGINVSNKSDLVDLLDRVKEESKKRILQAAQKGINTLKSIFPDMDIYVHETADSYNAAMIPNKGVRNSRGNFSFYEQDGKTKGRIDINLSNAAETTVAHEITHAILLKQFGEDLATFKQFRDRISKVISEDLDKELVAFEKKYEGKDVAPEEYLTQLAAILATRAETVTYKPSTLRKIAAIINELVTRITNGKFSPFKSEADFKNFVDFLNQISGAIREGKEVVVKEPQIQKKGLPSTPKYDIYEPESERPEQTGNRGRRYSSGSLAPLEGAPNVQGATGPDQNLIAAAEKYARENGIPLRRQAEYVKVDEDRAKRIAEAYEEMKHDPQNPKVKEAYEDLIRQTKAQYQALMDAGYEFSFFDENTDPYDENPYNAMRDLRQNKKMAVYGTYDGFGTEGITATELENNPMLQDTGLRWKDQKGNEQIVTANDLFRAVHDAFGHGLEGAGFRARGEENAWQAHVRLFTGPAIGAITTETRGQNSWLNYGPYGEKNKTAKVKDTVFAEQKTGLMPEWTWTEGRAADQPEIKTKQDLADEGTGIKLTGTEPIIKGDNAPTVTVNDKYQDDYSEEDILNKIHASNSRVISLASNMALGEIKYTKKGEKIKFNLPYANISAYKKIKSLREKYKLIKGSSKTAKAEKEKIINQINIVAKKVLIDFTDLMTQNILALYDTLTSDFVANSKQWYVGANRIANEIANKYKLTVEQTAGIIAALSPQNDWFNNVSVAERVIDVMDKYADTKLTKDIVDKAIKYNIKDGSPNDYAKDLADLFEQYGEVSINELNSKGISNATQSAILRAFDQALNSPKVAMTDPTGRFVGFDKTPIRWNPESDISKAIDIYRNKDIKNVNENLGNGNKVRNFYNNIVDPYSETPYVTADTHALSAALNSPISASDAGGFGLFNGNLEPSYALVKYAYIKAAEIAGVMPREMQSITWEAQRIGINDKKRTEEKKKETFDYILKSRTNEKSFYERATELIAANRSANPIWGKSRGIETQIPNNEILEGAELRSKQRISSLSDLRRSAEGKLGKTDTGMGKQPTGREGVGKGKIKSRQDIGEDYSEMKDIVQDYLDEGISLDDTIESITSELGDSSQETKDLITRAYNELKGAKPEEKAAKPEEAPKVEDKEAKKEFDKLTSTIPNTGEITTYLSGETIKKYEGDELRNEQQVLAQQLRPALERGLDIIQKAKELFGDNYVAGLLNYLETENLPPANKALIYVSLENELAKQKIENPSDAPRIEKLQDLVRAASQAYLRSNSLAINFGRLRKFAEIGYDVSKMTDRFFSSRQLEDKNKIEESIQATPDQINKAAEEKIKEDEEIKKKVEEGVEAEIAKLFEKFSDAKKKVINKSLSAIDKAMSKLSSKSYKSGFKSRSDLDDAMTEGFKKIKRAMKAGISPAEAIEIGIKEIKSIYEKEYGTTWTDEAAFRKDLTEALKAEGAISVNLIKKRIEELESQIKIYQEKIAKGGVPGEKRKGKFSDVEEVQKLIKERDELRKQNQKLIRESREQSGEMSRSEKALQKKIEALETELERVKFRKEKEKPEKNTPAEKKLTEREKELIKAIELENEKWDAEIDAARQMAKDYEKLETERNRQLKKVGELKEKLEILKSGKFPEGKKIEPKADTPEIEALKKEIEDTEKELRKNLAHQKRLDELEKELQRLKDRKEKEKNPEKKKEYSYDETLLRDQIEKERLDWKIEKNIEKLNKELDRVRNRREKITDPKQKRELTDEEKRITDEIKEEQKKWSEERVPIKKLENDILKLNEQIEKGQKDKFEKKATRESEALDRLRKEKAEKQAILEALDPTPRMFIENALIEQGFGREINVRTKDGVEKRMVLDWKKLAGEEGSIDNIKERVEAALRGKGYSEEQILRMKDAFVEEYNNLAASIAEKALNEINAKNKEGVTIEQKSAVRKLVEMYNYGLFDKDPVEYETALAKTLGVTGIGVDAVKKMAELGQTMSNLFNSNFEGQPLNESTLRTAIQVIEEQARVILNMEALKGGNWGFKVTELTRMYMDASQRMMLNTFKQGLENPISGLLERFYSSVAYAGKIPETLNAQQRKLARDIYKEMVFQKGLGYGNVGNAFITTGNIDAYVNKLPDSALVQGIMSVAMGKTILDAVDSSYKAKITQQKFTYNLIKILTKDRVINGKTVKGISLDEAKKYVADKISGQSFEKAKQTAKGIIDRVNRDAGRKIFNDSPQFVNRLANDIVNAALINGEAITEEMVTAAYNAAYRAAGRGLGHVSNNYLTSGVNYMTGKIETQRKKAIEEKRFTDAAFLNIYSMLFRNVLNPFVGGGTNWIVLKAEKTGLGLISGFISKVRNSSKIDMTSETGMKELEDAMYDDMKANDKLTRGAIGGMVTALAFLLIKGTAAEDEYEKWIKKNPWAKKYINVFTPEIVLLMVAANATEKDYKKYLENTLNMGDQFDKGKMALKVLYSKDRSTQLGTLLGSSIGNPLPWRLVRDGQQLWAGATGGEPYVVSKEKPKNFSEAYLKGGMFDFYKDMMSKEPKEKKIGEKFPESKGIKWLEDKNADMPELPDLEKIKVNVDDKHPEGKMTTEEQAKFKEIWEAEAVKVADQIQKNHEKYQYTLDKEKLKQIRQRISEVATKETHEKMSKYYKRDRLSSRDEEMFKIKILGKEIE